MKRAMLRSRSVASALLRSSQCTVGSSQTRLFSNGPDKVELQEGHMTASEAFVETLVSRGVTDVFGIVGSAFMDALDLFPDAGIRFISVQHEQNAAHMADGYARISGKQGVCVAQNGPGITNFVTGICAAYWAHSPVVAITPEGGTMTKGHGGFQEIDQIPIFESMTKYQAHVNNPARMAEFTGRAFDIALNERGPTQLNIPRDFFYYDGNFKIPQANIIEKSAGGDKALAEAAALISEAKNPVILAGGGVVMSEGGIDAVKGLADLLSAPVAVTYLHNDAFDWEHPLMVGPLGYQGHKSAMNCLSEADVVIAVGTRMSPFGTLPQYEFDYWPQNAKLIQIDQDPRRLSLTKEAAVNICGDAAMAASELTQRLSAHPGLPCKANEMERMAKVAAYKAEWEAMLDEWTNRPSPTEGLMRPRSALREMEKAMPANAIISSDIGNVCSVSNSYIRPKQSPGMLAAMTFGNCGYSFPAAVGAKIAAPDRPCFAYVGDGAWGMSLNELLTCIREKIPVTTVVFHNKQWGAEKKNQVLWFGDRYVGTNLENNFSYAEIARAMSAEGITCTSLDQVGDAIRQGAKNQEEGKTTVIELMLTRELGDPFRRDAMKLPQRTLKKYQGTSEEAESPTGQPVDLGYEKTGYI